MALSDPQVERYSRQIVLAGFGARGQQRLLDGSVLVAGEDVGRADVCAYLAAAGLGRILVIGAVEGGRRAAAALRAINADCRVEHGDFAAENDHRVAIADCDLAIAIGTGTDTTRRLAEACFGEGKPLLWGARAGGRIVRGRVRSLAELDGLHQAATPTAGASLPEAIEQAYLGAELALLAIQSLLEMPELPAYVESDLLAGSFATHTLPGTAASLGAE